MDRSAAIFSGRRYQSAWDSERQTSGRRKHNPRYLLILGLLLIMRGQQLIRLWLILSGALVGSTIGRGIANLINPLSPSLILIGIFTLLGAGLFATLLRGFIVTAGFATGALFAWTFVHAGTPQILGISSILVCAIAGGILAAMAFPWFIRLITAAAGSWMVINAVRTFLLQRPWFAERFAPTFPSAWPLWLLLPMALLTLIGVRLQRKRQKGLR